MKIFVSGATGVLGRRAVSELLGTGAHVTGIARGPRKRAELERLGATPMRSIALRAGVDRARWRRRRAALRPVLRLRQRPIRSTRSRPCAGTPGELGDPAAYRSVITTDDAATAVVAALRAPSGIYNVGDDEPLSRADNVAALAGALGVPTPVPPSVMPDLPPHLSAMLRSQRVSNARFKAATGWRPRFPSAREGWVHVVGER